MITGTDEHGEKIAIAAAKAGLEPQAHCDVVVAEYKDLWRQVLLRSNCSAARYRKLMSQLYERS